MACSLTAATLRFEVGKDPLNEELTALIGELSTRSPQFRRDWADHDVHEHRTGTLWRDGVVWRLDFTARRAVGTRRAADFTRQPLPLPAPFDTFPKELIAGKTCRVVPMPTAGFMDGESCLWTAFPAARFLGLPWPLRARTRLGMLKKMVTEDKAQFAERNGVLEPGLFDIPVGFTRVGPTP